VTDGAARTVLFLHSSAGRYGADRQLELIATGLDPARYRALVVLPEHGELAADLRGAGVDVRVRPLAVMRRALMSPRGISRVTAAWAADAGGLGRLARAQDAAVVHTNTSVTLGGAAAARIAAIPHVWHVREIYAEFERWWPAYRRLLCTADALPCVSEATCEQFGDAAIARVLPDGLPALPDPLARAQARGALGLDEDVFVAAVLGRISSWKGQEILARALADPALAERGAVGLIAGAAWRGEQRHERALSELGGRLGLGDRLRMLGFRDDPETIYGAADVVVVPSTQPDPLPNAAIEAAASGCCVVAAGHGGLPEILRSGETGVLVAPSDPMALAHALSDLAADPERVARLGAAAREDVRERFSAKRLLDSLQALYDELVANPPPHRVSARPRLSA
jgi:glycosyltransferase involved in cell wall biosynthesis